MKKLLLLILLCLLGCNISIPNPTYNSNTGGSNSTETPMNNGGVGNTTEVTNNGGAKATSTENNVIVEDRETVVEFSMYCKSENIDVDIKVKPFEANEYCTYSLVSLQSSDNNHFFVGFKVFDYNKVNYYLTLRIPQYPRKAQEGIIPEDDGTFKLQDFINKYSNLTNAPTAEILIDKGGANMYPYNYYTNLGEYKQTLVISRDDGKHLDGNFDFAVRAGMSDTAPICEVSGYFVLNRADYVKDTPNEKCGGWVWEDKR